MKDPLATQLRAEVMEENALEDGSSRFQKTFWTTKQDENYYSYYKQNKAQRMKESDRNKENQRTCWAKMGI